MNSVHVEAFDLNLLLAFDALWTERHVTRAARRIGLTQPAMSHALGRLRAQFDDVLFERGSHALVPSPRAQALAPALDTALALVRHALAPPTRFSPATLERTFTIASTDYSELVLLPRLLARLGRQAPGVRLVMRPIVATGERALLSGEHDLALGVGRPESAAVRGEALFTDGFHSLLRAGHRAARRPLTLDRFVALDHVLISPSGTGEAAVDVALRARGRTRRIVLRVPNFLSAPLVVAATDYIVTLPTRVARAVAAQHRLRLRRPPLELSGFAFSQFWHARHDDDPAHQWLRAEIKRATTDRAA
jgi:DNA-binding transcriptional LysR family regulator